MDHPRKIEGTACRGAGSTMDTISQDLPNCKGSMTESDRKGKIGHIPGNSRICPVFRAAPHNSARDSSERFCPKIKFGKRRNTLCISSFSNCNIGAKDPLLSADAIMRCCPIGYSRMMAGSFWDRDSRMKAAASAQVSFTCWPERISLTEHLPSAISSSPSKTTKGTSSLLA